MKTALLLPLPLFALLQLCGGCTTVPETAQRDLYLAGYTISVPESATVTQTLRPAREHRAGISPSPHGLDLAIHPQARVIRIPGRRGTLVIYDPDTEGHGHTYATPLLENYVYTLGCPPEGFYNGMHATETAGSHGNGRYYKTVQYDRCGNQFPAGLVGHYWDADWTTRQVFDRILISVRR